MYKILFASGLYLTLTISVFGQTKNFIDLPYIEVNGLADTLVTPNQIFIKIIISEKDSRDKLSVEEQENRMITAFKALNIKTETDLTTSDMLSSYKFYFLKTKDIFKAKEYILKVSDASSASDVFVQLENIGISNASIDRVDHTNLEDIRNICKAKAVENAQKKAMAMTKPISQTIGNAIHIFDNEANFGELLQGRVAGVMIRGIGTLDKQRYTAPKIEFEKIKVTATVSVKFALKLK